MGLAVTIAEHLKKIDVLAVRHHFIIKVPLKSQIRLKFNPKLKKPILNKLIFIMPSEKTLSDYYDTTGREDILTGGIKMIPIQTPFGEFKVWTKRIGNNPTIKVLLLHGGPGATHEFFECVDSFFPAEGFEYYYYDQLGSYYSDQPTEPGL